MAEESDSQEDSKKGLSGEHRLQSALFGRGYEVWENPIKTAHYDLSLKIGSEPDIRIEVRTIGENGRLSFARTPKRNRSKTGGAKNEARVHNTKTADVVAGVDIKTKNGDETDYYFIPTIVVEKLGQQGITTSRIQMAKNNWELLFKCRDRDFALNIFAELLAK